MEAIVGSVLSLLCPYHLVIAVELQLSSLSFRGNQSVLSREDTLRLAVSNTPLPPESHLQLTHPTGLDTGEVV